jgi:hypothetical protein
MALNDREKELGDRLEELVDLNDIDKVIGALAQVCWAKSAHLEENWQDRILAKYWGQIAQDLNNINRT